MSHMEQPLPKRRPGRPPKPLDQVKRDTFQTRIRSPLKQRLEEAAAENGRSLSEEIEARLEASWRDENAFFPPPLLHQGRRLLGAYVVNGCAGVVRQLTRMPDPVTLEPPDDAEKKRRWEEMRDMLAQARWASPEAEERYQRVQQKVDGLKAEFVAREAAAARPKDEAA